MIPNCRPRGYNKDTKCCIRCSKVIDRSHPDAYELYCGSDGVPEPKYPTSDELNDEEQYDRKARAWYKWSVPRRVDPWGSCPLFDAPKKSS